VDDGAFAIQPVSQFLDGLHVAVLALGDVDLGDVDLGDFA
jgi:hypothetical protein